MALIYSSVEHAEVILKTLRLCGKLNVFLLQTTAGLDMALPFQAISKNTVTALSLPCCWISTIIDQPH